MTHKPKTVVAGNTPFLNGRRAGREIKEGDHRVCRHGKVVVKEVKGGLLVVEEVGGTMRWDVKISDTWK